MSNFALRIPDHVMAQAKVVAEEDRISVNQLFVSFISEGLGHRRGLMAMQERADRADVAAALAILDRAPDVAPDAGDERPGPVKP
ncbi:hypothetical protein [Methylobacterium sp. A54F]